MTKNPAQSMPTQAERDGPFNLPPSGDDELPPVPACVDHDPSVAPSVAPTLTNVAGVIFSQSCSFNACHGATGQAAGLDLSAPDLLTELLNHEVLGDPGASLVEPGGQLLALNAPILLSDPSVALVREWIAAGAPND